MKKGLGFFLIAAGIITLGLRFLNSINLGPISSSQEGEPVTTTETKEVDLNAFLSGYDNGLYEKIVVQNGTSLQGYQPQSIPEDNIRDFFGITVDKHYRIYQSNKPADSSLSELGIVLTGENAVPVTIEYDEESLLGTLFLEQILPLLFFILIIVLAFKFFGPKSGRMPFGGSKAGILRTKTDVKTKFKDVAGLDEVKQELIEIVDFLKSPKKYQKVGARIPKGVLLFGAPGSGKTLLARAVAGEAGVPFFTVSGSEFMEMLVGMGAAKVRDLFKKAKAASPAIIFIDEIDTIGKRRGSGQTGGHQEQEQTLNQILTEMDGFDQDTNVIVIAATNRPDILDKALLRAGRFDRKVYVGNPALEERKMILELHAKDKKLADDVDLEQLARRTSGFVGADLENIVNEAALQVAKTNRKKLTMDDFEYALEKVVMGPEKKIKSLKDKERKIVTYHELGHAVTAYHLPNADPVEKISIVSRGMALGITWMMPTEDRHLHSKAKFKDEMTTLLGGRAAEEIFFGKEEITTGAANDFEKVTKIAYNMVLKYGMDEELGTIMYYDQEKSEFQPFKPYSEKLAEKVDTKVQKLADAAYEQALKILNDNKQLIDKMADLLLEKEYITKEEFLAMMKDPDQVDELIEKYKEKHEKKMNKAGKQSKRKKKKEKKKKKGKEKKKKDKKSSKRSSQKNNSK